MDSAPQVAGKNECIGCKDWVGPVLATHTFLLLGSRLAEFKAHGPSASMTIPSGSERRGS